MLAIEVWLLTGRYAAASSIDRDEGEWPPHPARLYSAMVSGWAEEGKDAAERAALEWLEQQPPPRLLASAADKIYRRNVLTHFVPGNDVSVVRDVHRLGVRLSEAHEQVLAFTGDAKSHKTATRVLEKLRGKAIADTAKAVAVKTASAAQVEAGMMIFPEHRNRQARTYPVVRPDDDRFVLHWPQAQPEEHTPALERLLGRVGRLGHSSSLVSCRLVPDVPQVDADQTYQPMEASAKGQGRWPLRVMVPELLAELELAHAQHQGVEPRVLPRAYATYTNPVERVVPLAPATAGPWWVFDLLDGDVLDGQPVGVTRVVELTRALRGAIMSHSADPLPALLSGHREPAEPAGRHEQSGRHHAQWLGLPIVGGPQADGRLGALAVSLPRGAGAADCEVLEQGVQAFLGSGGRGRLNWPGGHATLTSVRMSAADSYDHRAPRRTTQRGYWARASRRWTSATPVALDRFPRAARSAAAAGRLTLDAEVAQIVAKACCDIGLPRPATVDILGGSPLRGVPIVRPGRSPSRGPARFGFYQAASSRQVRYSVHVQVQFDEVVTGPLVLGAGRHFGYGLMLPTPEATVGRR